MPLTEESAMSTRPFLICLLALALLAAPGLAPDAAAGDDTWTVKLRDGSTHEGVFLRLFQGTYLLQTDDALLELSDDDIDPDTFADRPRREAQPRRQLSVANHYVELHRDGTATRYLTLYSQNRGDRAITEYRYGLAPWEQHEIDQRVSVDWFGNPIPQRFDPPRDEWEADWDRNVRVIATLPVPVAPGEFWSTASRATVNAHLRRVDEGLAWAHLGDYAEDRVVWLKVRLPHGAETVRVTPEPTFVFEQDGFRYVMWRQFYRKGERRPLEVVYTFE
jgi:hypothetical protein